MTQKSINVSQTFAFFFSLVVRHLIQLGGFKTIFTHVLCMRYFRYSEQFANASRFRQIETLVDPAATYFPSSVDISAPPPRWLAAQVDAFSPLVCLNRVCAHTSLLSTHSSPLKYARYPLPSQQLSAGRETAQRPAFSGNGMMNYIRLAFTGLSFK